jgi:hypothetical protein
MLAIAIVLVATGVVGVGFIFLSVACTAMMAVMMRGMNHGGTEHGGMDHGGVNHSVNRPADRPSHTTRGRPRQSMKPQSSRSPFQMEDHRPHSPQAAARRPGR